MPRLRNSLRRFFESALASALPTWISSSVWATDPIPPAAVTPGSMSFDVTAKSYTIMRSGWGSPRVAGNLGVTVVVAQPTTRRATNQKE